MLGVSVETSGPSGRAACVAMGFIQGSASHGRPVLVRVLSWCFLVDQGPRRAGRETWPLFLVAILYGVNRTRCCLWFKEVVVIAGLAMASLSRLHQRTL